MQKQIEVERKRIAFAYKKQVKKKQLEHHTHTHTSTVCKYMYRNLTHHTKKMVVQLGRGEWRGDNNLLECVYLFLQRGESFRGSSVFLSFDDKFAKPQQQQQQSPPQTRTCCFRTECHAHTHTHETNKITLHTRARSPATTKLSTTDPTFPGLFVFTRTRYN